MVMQKVILLGFFLIMFFSSLAFADVIYNYVVPSSVPLNQKILATGLFSSTDSNNGVKCSFYYLDSLGNLVYRATDQLTVSTGRFTMTGTTLTEPVFVRGQTYTLRSECGTASSDLNFIVSQKQEAFGLFGFNLFPQSVGYDLSYWLNSDNAFAMIWLLIMVGAGVYVIYAFWFR